MGSLLPLLDQLDKGGVELLDDLASLLAPLRLFGWLQYLASLGERFLLVGRFIPSVTKNEPGQCPDQPHGRRGFFVGQPPHLFQNPWRLRHPEKRPF